MTPNGLGREFLWVVVGQGTAAVGALLGVRLLTQLLPPGAYGELALGLTGATLAQQALFSPLSASVLRYFAVAREAGALGPYLSSVWTLARAAVLLLLVAGTLVVGLVVLLGAHGWLGLVAGAVAFAVVVGLYSLLDGLQNAARQRAVVAWHDGATPWVRFLLAAALVTAVGATGGVALTGFVAATAALLASQWWFYRRRVCRLAKAGAGEERARWRGALLAYGWPFATWGLFSWAQVASDRWALQAFASTEAVGLYAVLFQTGYYPMTLLSTLLSQLLVPIMFAKAGDGSDPDRFGDAHRMNRRLLVVMATFTVAGVAAAALFHRPLFAVLVAPEYRATSSLLPAMVAAGGLFACGQAASLTLLSATASRGLVPPKIVTGMLGTAFNATGAAIWGVPGVVAAGVATTAFYMGWVVLLAEGAAASGAVPARRVAPQLIE